jgi:peptidoglycan/LPS O-acetylase OafA/YrhL
MKSLRHEPALDGLRAMAVMSVVLFHAVPHVLPGGFYGVDVFFALSGYLITRLLLNEHTTLGRIDLWRFYVRRSWRLAPALCLMLLVYVSIELAWHGFAIWKTLALDALLALSYVTNWTRATGWHLPADLGHTWSLAVEEQFYLLWPLLLIGVLKLSRRRGVQMLLVGAMALASLLWRLYLQDQGASVDRLYNGSDVRAETLLWGALLAIWQQHEATQQRHHWFDQVGAWLIPALMLGLWFGAQWTDAWVYSVGISAVSGMSVLLIKGLHGGRWRMISRALTVGWIVYLGRISYGIYLWHFPILRWLMESPMDAWSRLVCTLALSLSAASLSYHFMEKPLLDRRDRRR